MWLAATLLYHDDFEEQQLGCLWPELKPEKQERLLRNALELAFCVEPERGLSKVAAAPPFRFQET